jgi:uncharacterized protein YjbI with pentapeptide repeats
MDFRGVDLTKINLAGVELCRVKINAATQISEGDNETEDTRDKDLRE